jgi:hypothetical protein
MAPPPPAASDEEAVSGAAASDEEPLSGLGSEEEEEITYSPPPAAPKTMAPPPHQGQECEEAEKNIEVPPLTTKSPSPPLRNPRAQTPQPKPSLNQVAEGKGANSGALREAAEMRKLYPYLADELMELEKEHPGLWMQKFGMLDDDKERALNRKIKKRKMCLTKLYERRCDFIKNCSLS